MASPRPEQTATFAGPLALYSSHTTAVKMVKSHVDCSPDLTWALVQKHNVFVRRSRSATRQKTFRSFSAEANNLLSLHTYKNSGACGCDASRRSLCSRAAVGASLSGHRTNPSWR